MHCITVCPPFMRLFWHCHSFLPIPFHADLYKLSNCAFLLSLCFQNSHQLTQLYLQDRSALLLHNDKGFHTPAVFIEMQGVSEGPT